MSVFTANPANSVRSLGERELLNRIREWLGAAAPASPRGMGDDCAVLPASVAPVNLVTVDALVYGRHFDDSVPAASAGAKLLKRNLSDIAAMGGTPLSAVVSLILAPETRVDFLEAFTRGMAACALEYGVTIVGGDLTEAPGFFGGSLTLLGHAARPITRKGGQIGDWIAVTGALGGSILGHHHEFTPRLREGAWLAAQPDLCGMMDVTDGLAKDLCELLPVGGAAALDLAELPLSEAATELAARDGLSALDHALTDGEDYELVFTVSKETDPIAFRARYEEALGKPPCFIGKIIAHVGRIRLLEANTLLPITPGTGYEHFGKIN
ncbi:MAG: thiamine-phosphate kinase [Verrucomicrobiota bacterium]|nr:thiamine-phosphate kinase [Verrucomicrobiota bacterium]